MAEPTINGKSTVVKAMLYLIKGTVVGPAEYKKNLDNLFKEKRDSKTDPKGGNSAWADYDDKNLYQDRYVDD